MGDQLIEEWQVYETLRINDYMDHRAFFEHLQEKIQGRFKRPVAVLDLGGGDLTAIVPMLTKVPLQRYVGIDESDVAPAIKEWIGHVACDYIDTRHLRSAEEYCSGNCAGGTRVIGLRVHPRSNGDVVSFERSGADTWTVIERVHGLYNIIGNRADWRTKGIEGRRPSAVTANRAKEYLTIDHGVGKVGPMTELMHHDINCIGWICKCWSVQKREPFIYGAGCRCSPFGAGKTQDSGARTV